MNYELINNVNFKNFEVDKNYPEITLNSLSKDALTRIKRVYAGSKSEFTSLTQYSYQHFVTRIDKRLSEVSKGLEKIAEKEMEHFEILANVLASCGIDPKPCIYIDSNPNICDYWKSSSVDYTKEFIKMIESDILLENKAISEYNEIMEITDNENLKEIIARILEDEYSHIEYFNAILKA